MPDEVTSTKLLICPGDHVRTMAKDWKSLTAANISYEIVAPGVDVKEMNTVFVRCRLHGHQGYVDMTVFDGIRRGIRRK